MQATFHLNSAQEVSSNLLEAIKATFQSRPITITIEEETDEFDLSDEMKLILDQRLKENNANDISAEISIQQLKTRYGV